MEYGKIIAVTGLPGLYELLTSKSDGAIVRSLDEKNTQFVSSRVHNFSHLESIEVYTVRENINLTEIFHAMEKSSEKIPDGKDAGVLKKYFEKVYPDIDFERVYSSDLKKMANWFSVLKDNKIEIKLSEREPEEETIPEEPKETKKEAVPEKKKEKKEAPKEAPKKTASKKSAPKKETTEKAPAKKAAPVKKGVTEKKATKKAAPRKNKSEE